jgi:hypothetical protein
MHDPVIGRIGGRPGALGGAGRAGTPRQRGLRPFTSCGLTRYSCGWSSWYLIRTRPSFWRRRPPPSASAQTLFFLKRIRTQAAPVSSMVGFEDAWLMNLLGFVSSFVLRISNFAWACQGWH